MSWPKYPPVSKQESLNVSEKMTIENLLLMCDKTVRPSLKLTQLTEIIPYQASQKRIILKKRRKEKL